MVEGGDHGDSSATGSDENRTISLEDGEAGPARQVAGRYNLEAHIGSGGSGTVWRGTDTATGAAVAVKLLTPGTSTQLVRVSREINALRLLRLPGVVRLIDSGIDGNHHFIVMELVSGDPFPGVGVAGTWEELAPRIHALLDVLRVVHAQGVVHRDLKPANVLVDHNGKVTLLDFGLARGETLDPTVTAAQAILGTPRYLAPEQLTGGQIDVRTDLYAVGVMLFELLAGAPPHAEADFRALAATRLTQDAPPLRSRAPSVPDQVGDVVDRLLARAPEGRPRSVDDVLAALLPGAHRTRPPLPMLGREALITAFLEAARAGRPLDLCGPPGSGRSRLLREVAARLRDEGLVVFELGAGERPLESMSPLVGRPTDTAGKPIAVAEERLSGALKSGVVLVVDDWERLDRWSRSLLDRLRLGGAVLRVADSVGALKLEPLEEADLHALFHGPDTILHLREDGARVLYDRSRGAPAAIVREVNAWVSAGIARWEAGRLHVDRLGLDRLDAGLFLAPPGGGSAGPTLEGPLDDLLAWVALAGRSAHPDFLHVATGIPTWELEAELSELHERGVVRSLPGGNFEAVAVPGALQRWSDSERVRAHRALAAHLPPGSPSRIEHLAAAGDAPAVAEEALVLARRLIPAGAAARAMGVLTVALAGVRADPRRPREKDLLVELARAALAEGSVPSLKAARFEVARDPSGLDLGRLLEAWEATQARQGQRAEAIAADLPAFADAELETYRLLIPVRVAAGRDPTEAERRVRALADEPDPSGLLRSRRLLAWGHVRFRQGRYLEAARLYHEVARDELGPDRRASALVNAGNALREGGAYEEALQSYEQAAALAARHRLAVLEAGALVGHRTASYLRGDFMVPDPELVSVVAGLGDPSLHSLIAFTEAAVAWRAGDLPLGERLAREAEVAFDRPGTKEGRRFAGALAALCSGRQEEVLPLLSGTLDDLVGCQIAAVACALGVPLSAPVRERALAAARAAPDGRLRLLDRREVLTMLEAPARPGGGSGLSSAGPE